MQPFQDLVAHLVRAGGSDLYLKSGSPPAMRVHGEAELDDLGLPPVVANLASELRGIVLVTGPSGVGKTTTIAAMIGHINRNRRWHIITLEDPIEVVHPDAMCLIDQREVGTDIPSYAA